MSQAERIGKGEAEAPESTELPQEIRLASGRRLTVTPGPGADLIEVTEPGGQVTLTVRLTDQGPVVTVAGARLEIEARESISLKAKEVRIEAGEKASIESRGKLNITSDDLMRVHSDDDVKVTGKIIHLN